MADEKKESNVKVENLPQGEKELTTEEAKEVQGGFFNMEALPVIKKKEKSEIMTDLTPNP